MESIDDMILEPLEGAFNAVGAMQGDLAPVKRAAIGAALGYGIAYYVQPKFAWMKDNTGKMVPKPFAGTATKDQKDVATWFPTWAIIGAPAVIFSVLI